MEKNGIGEKFLAGAAPRLVPRGAAGPNSLPPAGFEAATRYTKSPSAGLLEFALRRVMMALELGLPPLGEALETHGSFFSHRPAADRGAAGRWQSATNEQRENLWFSNGQEFQVAFVTIVLATE